MRLIYIITGGANIIASLKALTSSNKEVRPFFLGDNSNWSFPLVLPLAITAVGGPEGYFSLHDPRSIGLSAPSDLDNAAILTPQRS